MNNLNSFYFNTNNKLKYFLILIFLFTLIFELTSVQTNNKKKQKYMKICEKIAKDIELLKLKEEYPQLKNFSLKHNLNKEACKINYEYKCHLSNKYGGWTSQVPNPDTDGIWFYISLWDESDPIESYSQINTQPIIPKWYIRSRRVTYLILEGEKTKSIDKEILKILKKHGLH
jgi:hypothetical protein